MPQDYEFIDIPDKGPKRSPLFDAKRRYAAKLHNRYAPNVLSGKIEI